MIKVFKCLAFTRVFNALLSDLQRLIGRAPKKPRMKKPPEGIMPRFLHEENRLWDLGLAIDRYKAAGKEVPRAWTIEQEGLYRRLYGAGTGQPILSLELATEIYSKIAAILDGIDRTVDDDRGGWWQTKDGAQVGKIKLIQLKDLIFKQFSSDENI